MKRICRILVVCLATSLCSAQIQITLSKDFVNKYADRVTIDSNFRVDITSKIHPASQDGDIHVAGTAPEIGMIAVAEVMNAKTEKTQAVKVLMDAVGSDHAVKITGAWRIWCEHGGNQDYIQGQAVPVAASSGEAHVFEIHPITKVDGSGVEHTWAPTPGFTYKDATQAFQIYERTRSQISETDSTITISTELAGYNYTEFVAKLLEDPVSLTDGTAVFADILDTQGELLVHRRRLVFAAGTDPETAVRTMHKGQVLQVVGIPRFDLKLVQFRLKNHTGRFAGSLTWNIPYEMIVAAVTDSNPEIPQ